jgi:hypothetical protein
VEVYHFSEDPTITAFVPRPSRLGEALVWAIDAWSQPLYWLPRDCPRVTFYPLPGSSEADLERWWSAVSGRIVVAIEAAWLERVRACQLFRYRFDAAPFTPLPDDPWMLVSRTTVCPLAVEPVGDLLEAHAAGGVELRICQSLVPLGKAIINSSLHWGLIRMRNAAGWE